jgi:hypothetical protein
MRKTVVKLILAVVLLTAFMLPGCARAGSALNGSGKVIDQDVNITNFNSISIEDAILLEISQAKSFKVIVNTDDNLVNRIRLSLEHQTLKISIEAPASFFPTSLKVKIEMPVLIGLNLTKGAKATISGFKSPSDFNLAMSGGSILVGSLEAGVTYFTLSGGSQVALQGVATRLELDCSEKSKLNLADFALTKAEIKLRGASEAIMNVGGEFGVTLSDASKVYYLGNPIFINTYITGGSTMARQDEPQDDENQKTE